MQSNIMRELITLALLFTSYVSFGQEVEIPENYEIIAVKKGDLNGDKIDEKVVIYETDSITDLGNAREIRIFKLVDNKWVIWKNSKNAILKKEDGGMMGDPFENIEIKKGILIISFAGRNKLEMELY